MISALYFMLFKTMGRKCVVPNCRSGLQPNKKEVEDLADKDAPDNFGRKISIFKFPEDEYMLQKWIKAIPREGDHWATSYNGVCELHFQNFFSLIQTLICMETAVNVLRLDQRPYHEPFRTALNI